MTPDDVLTTGKAAKLAQVSQATVMRWIDTGILKGFRIPGSTARRVQVKELLKLFKEHNMPIPEVLSNSTTSDS